MQKYQDLNNYGSINKDEHDQCIGIMQHSYSINGISAEIRLHYLKFDGNGKPMMKALANLLYSYIIDYCISSKNRTDTLTTQQAAQLTREARRLFRHPEITDESPDKTGEAGEMLLFFLIESILNAPQVVSKMELKTNHKDEVKGSDGIHAHYDEIDQIIDFYFGESKLYKKASDAMDAALKSINDFHDIDMCEHEFTMTTKHFKYADEEVKKAISSLIIHGQPGPNVRINHACLIGYDFKKFASLSGNGSRELENNFLHEFSQDTPRLIELLQNKFDKFNKKHLRFEVFFIPFPSVVEFRNAFNDALN
ncbi:hypothetical protein BI343_17140 [Chromobacterium amazonense]|uniref:HamA C-terminal domain-containing protein n=1 Tax=Chromobacterium amazonense TaxID=1382803 RepID=UPI0008D9FAD1|nr:DUF1837 domain-containing protein [Chromobacterium amazonense]OHX15972.1 hypothetical protein BI343_17140 [Chromobacterium amazonense]